MWEKTIACSTRVSQIKFVVVAFGCLSVGRNKFVSGSGVETYHFKKDMQVVSNCQDFSGHSQNATEKTEFHRCCIIDERASLIQWENVTLERKFEQKPEDTDKCQILEYGPALKIEFCQSDKQDSSISTGTSLYHSYLSIVIVIPIIIILLL